MLKLTPIMADSYRIAFLLLELTFMFNSEYMECIVHTYQYESIFIICSTIKFKNVTCIYHLMSVICTDDCAIHIYRIAQFLGGRNFGKFSEPHIIHKYFTETNLHIFISCSTIR